jgi:hypothetical protein
MFIFTFELSESRPSKSLSSILLIFTSVRTMSPSTSNIKLFPAKRLSITCLLSKVSRINLIDVYHFVYVFCFLLVVLPR